MKPSTIPTKSIVLWTIGGLISGVSVTVAILSGVRDCSNNAMCSMSAAIEMLFAFLALFVGALITVAGFSARSTHRRAMHQQHVQQDIQRLINEAQRKED